MSKNKLDNKELKMDIKQKLLKGDKISDELLGFQPESDSIKMSDVIKILKIKHARSLSFYKESIRILEYERIKSEDFKTIVDAVKQFESCKFKDEQCHPITMNIHLDALKKIVGHLEFLG